MSCRLVVLGGSAVSTVQFHRRAGRLATRPDGLELVLHGRSWRLEAVAGACRTRAGTVALPVSVQLQRPFRRPPWARHSKRPSAPSG
jgi:hypothetical protein